MVTMAKLETKDQSIDWSGPGILLIEHAPMPMAMVEGANHIIRHANPDFCRLIGKPAEFLVGKPFCEMMPGEGNCAKLLGRVFRTGKPEDHREVGSSKPHPVTRSYTLWPVIANGRSEGVMIQVTEISKLQARTLAVNEALVLGSVRLHELTEAADLSNAQLQKEINERELAEDALHRAQARLTDRAGQLQGLVAKRTSELSATNSQLEAFVYSIAHDLRAPLRAMQGFSAMLVEEAGAGMNDTARGYADRIDKSAQFMDALLTDLLAFSRISQQQVELTPVQLGKIVETTLSRLQKEIQEQKAQVESSGPWPVVLAHESTLAQVVFNLTSNALKFVVPEVPPQMGLRAEERGEFIRVWVEDNGPGISPGHQSQIFRLFTRLEGEKYAGTGIGLAIVQKGIERMGGRVGVESVPGQGSRFWFELKRA